MSNHPIPINPEPAESAMLSTFRQYRIRARRLARSRCRLLIGDKMAL